MAELIRGIREDVVAANLERIGSQIESARARSPRGRAGVRLLAATKYVAPQELPVLARAGVTLVGENRAQDLQQKCAAHGELFEWHFIGQLQSRKVKAILPHVAMIHSVASESALAELTARRALAREGLRILVEVNVSGESGKAGIEPERLDAYIARSAFPVAGLMTMPPLAADPAQSRGCFAALRRLADERGLEHLSMGTSQDYTVAVEEGATIVRIGTLLYTPAPPEI